jgi:hypothetical protein
MFRAVAEAFDITTVLYPGCFVDITPSFVWPSVTYVDVDRRAGRFFDDADGVREIVASHDAAPTDPDIRFVQADYTEPLGLSDAGFDLLVSLYAGPISRWCTRYVRVGGLLLVNPSHGDVALASIDPRYELAAIVHSRSDDYTVSTDELGSYLVPKDPAAPVTVERIERSGRGVAYTRSAFAYLFRRIG